MSPLVIMSTSLEGGQAHLVGGVDVGPDGGPAGLQHVRGAEGGGGHGGPALQPGVLLQVRQLQTLLRVHRQQTWRPPESRG